MELEENDLSNYEQFYYTKGQITTIKNDTL